MNPNLTGYFFSLYIFFLVFILLVIYLGGEDDKPVGNTVMRIPFVTVSTVTCVFMFVLVFLIIIVFVSH